VADTVNITHLIIFSKLINNAGFHTRNNLNNGFPCPHQLKNMTKPIKIAVALMAVCSLALAGFGCIKTASDDNVAETGNRSLTEIVENAERPSELAYDMRVTNYDGTVIESKAYTKGTKFRQESDAAGQKIIILGDTEGDMYTYYPVQNTAMKINFNDEVDDGTVEEDPFTALEEVMDTVNVTGYEYIDDKKCVVVEYMAEGFNQTMWIWERYGMPIKIETTTSQGTSVTEFYNIETHGIDDTLFELPDGVIVTDLSNIMQGNFDPSMFEGLGQ